VLTRVYSRIVVEELAMSQTTGELNKQIIQEVLEIYPEKTRKEREKHMMVTDPAMESVGKCIISNRKSQPGVMTVRGCAYAGSKGVVLAQLKIWCMFPMDLLAAGSIPVPGVVTITPV